MIKCLELCQYGQWANHGHEFVYSWFWAAFLPLFYACCQKFAVVISLYLEENLLILFTVKMFHLALSALCVWYVVFSSLPAPVQTSFCFLWGEQIKNNNEKSILLVILISVTFAASLQIAANTHHCRCVTEIINPMAVK